MTVAEAIATCVKRGHPDTSLLSGISRQIIAEVMRIAPAALVPVHSAQVRPLNANVHLFFQPAAATSLADVAAGRGLPLVVVSGLRTCIQQVMLYHCYTAGAGVPLAAKPGSSNHERGAAVDVEDYHGWQAFFLRRGWAWMGSKDPSHYSFTGAGVRGDLAEIGVKAFQSLASRHGHALKIDGAWGPVTEGVALSAPAGGYMG